MGAFNSALVLGPNNLLLKLAPDRSASAYLAVFNAVVGLVTALAPMLGGALAGWLHDVYWSLGPISLVGVKFVFLFSFLGRICSLLLLRHVAEPEAEPVGRVLRRLRDAGSWIAIMRHPVGRQVRREGTRRQRRLPAPHVAVEATIPEDCTSQPLDDHIAV